MSAFWSDDISVPDGAPDAPWVDFMPDESAMPDFDDIPPLDEFFPNDSMPGDSIPGALPPGKASPGRLPGQGADGEPFASAGQGQHQDARGVVCPSCRTNRLVLRQGRNGPFWGCQGFPRCRFTCQDLDGQPLLPQGGSGQNSGRR